MILANAHLTFFRIYYNVVCIVHYEVVHLNSKFEIIGNDVTCERN